MKKNYYVVWNGKKPGIYDNWEDCQSQVKGFPNAIFRGYPNLHYATCAWRDVLESSGWKIPTKGICVDASYLASQEIMEYRGVSIKDNRQIFRKAPVSNATVNLGEFLAIVHALALCKRNGSQEPIYSDSVTAITWVRKKCIKTKLKRLEKTAEVWDLTDRAINWLQENTVKNNILKWNTKEWGEIPADFGRK